MLDLPSCELQGIIQIAEEMAIATEEVAFHSHLDIAAAAVLSNLLGLDDLVDMVMNDSSECHN